MSVLDRSALDESPLADLHTIASELSIDGYRRLRRADLIDAILIEQPAAATETDSEDSEEDRSTRRRRGRRGGRGRTAGSDDESPEADTEPEPVAKPRRRTRRADADEERPERAPRSS
ncbi:MAG: Rho termination factor N-terminal domain-containing protein, partial [Solirubrobacteraceae bacterium]